MERKTLFARMAKEAHLTYADLARITGIHESRIKDYAAGRVRAGVGYLDAHDIDQLDGELGAGRELWAIATDAERRGQLLAIIRQNEASIQATACWPDSLGRSRCFP